MFEKWGTFYLMVGSSAAALVGLLFVVVTINAESNAANREIGSRTFLTPTIFHFAMVFLVSTLAVMPDIDASIMALAVIVIGLIGLVVVGLAVGRIVFGRFPAPHWTDYIFYGLLPIIAYLGLLSSGVGLWLGAPFAVHGLAVVALGLLLLGLRDAWDLATWLSYHKDT